MNICRCDGQQPETQNASRRRVERAELDARSDGGLRNGLRLVRQFRCPGFLFRAHNHRSICRKYGLPRAADDSDGGQGVADALLRARGENWLPTLVRLAPFVFVRTTAGALSFRASGARPFRRICRPSPGQFPGFWRALRTPCNTEAVACRRPLGKQAGRVRAFGSMRESMNSNRARGGLVAPLIYQGVCECR